VHVHVHVQGNSKLHPSGKLKHATVLQGEHVFCVFVLLVQVLRHQHYHAGVAGPLTEAGAFLEALQLLPLQKSNNTVVWGKSDELMELVAKVGCLVPLLC
jgi:hypothetical protein